MRPEADAICHKLNKESARGTADDGSECCYAPKWVRPDKIDGKYLAEVSGKEAIWNWRP